MSRQSTVEQPTRSVLRLPKAHLHVHLDGAYPVAAVQELAATKGHAFAVPDSFADVWQFFDLYGTVPALVETHEELAALCRALVRAEADLGVVYVEPAVEPQLYAPRLGSLRQVTATVLSAFAEAASDVAIDVGVNLTINTDSDEALAWELTRTAIAFAARGVTTLGTAGFVEPAGLGRFREHAAAAHAAGLSVVSHAGQTGGPDSVEQALRELTADRIAHGIRAAESPELMRRLADAGVMCDVCPVSNVRLGLIADLADHPAPRLLAAGVPVSLNADDPLWFGRSIADQYEIARRDWGFDDHGLAQIARHSSTAAGITDATRQAMAAGIDAWLDEGTSR